MSLTHEGVSYYEYYREIPKYLFWDQLKGSLAPLNDMRNDLFDTFKCYPSGFFIFIDFIQPLRGLGNIVLGIINLACVPIVFLLKSLWYCFTPSTFLVNMKINIIQFIPWLIEGVINIFRGITQFITTPLTWIRMPFRAFIIKKLMPLPSLDFSKAIEQPLSGINSAQITLKLLADDGIKHILSFLDGQSIAFVKAVSRLFHFHMNQVMQVENYFPHVIQQEITSQEINGEKKKDFFLDYYKKAFKLRLKIKKCLADNKTSQDEIDSLFAQIIYDGYDQFIPLLQHKINPSTVLIDKTDIPNETFVHIAASKGRFLILKWLLENGAPADVRDKGTTGEGESITYLSEFGSTPLHWAALYGHVSCLTLLLDYHADINSRNMSTGDTALHFAARNGHLECINILIAQGAQLNICNKDRKIPLHLAQDNNHLVCVEKITRSMQELILPIPPNPSMRRSFI